MVEHANIIASVGQPKLIENVARSVGNDNNGLHTEPFLGRASMLCFLYGPGEPGRYVARMSVPNLPNEILAALPQSGSGIVAQFDLADAKRRNNYLGFEAVDRDIEELTTMLASHPFLASHRIAGDKWAALLPSQNTEPLFQLVKRFERRQPVVVGWTATASRRFWFDNKGRCVKTSILYRNLRCVFSLISVGDEFAEVWQRIYDRLPYARVGEPVEINDDSGFIVDYDVIPRWKCIDDDVARMACPKCASVDFNWYDGDSSVFGGCGICQKCGADVEFRNSFSLCPDGNDAT